MVKKRVQVHSGGMYVVHPEVTKQRRKKGIQLANVMGIGDV
jgi:hypothetical protein